MDWVNAEVKNLSLSTPPQRSVSTDACVDMRTVQTLRETQSFTGALEELRLEPNIPRKHHQRYIAQMEAPVVTLPTCCSCGCLERSANKPSFRTRERDSMKLYVSGPDILNFQGQRYSADDIAPLWKKDCRMWLWKAVCSARKRKRQLAMFD